MDQKCKFRNTTWCLPAIRGYCRFFMGFLLGECVASMVSRGNPVCTWFYLVVTKALRYRKEGKGSKAFCKYGTYSFWSVFVCIISFDLTPSVSFENEMTCYWLTCNKSGHVILSLVCHGKLSVITLERLLLKKLLLNKFWINSRLCGKELSSTVGVGVFRDAFVEAMRLHQALEG